MFLENYLAKARTNAPGESPNPNSAPSGLFPPGQAGTNAPGESLNSPPSGLFPPAQGGLPGGLPTFGGGRDGNSLIPTIPGVQTKAEQRGSHSSNESGSEKTEALRAQQPMKEESRLNQFGHQHHFQVPAPPPMAGFGQNDQFRSAFSQQPPLRGPNDLPTVNSKTEPAPQQRLGNHPLPEGLNNGPGFIPRREETVSKLSHQQLAMPRISVYIEVPEKHQKFLAYLDRRVHHTVKDFKLYLGQSIQIDDVERVILIKKLPQGQPVQVTDLAMIDHQNKLILRKDDWLYGKTDNMPYSLKPPEPEFLANGSKVYLRAYSLQTDQGSDFFNAVKREGELNSDAYQVESTEPVFQVMRNHTRQNPRFASLFHCENENTVIKTENGYIPQIKPKYLELSTQIKNLILQKLQEQKEDDELPEGAPRPNRITGNTIIERYIDRQREEAEAELKYAKNITLEGFKPWDTWVPMPYPHRELNFARKMYMRGDNLLVQSPDFWEFANDVKGITNKNTLIWKVKKLAMDRGFKGKLSAQQVEGKTSQVIMICNKSGKSTAKNPSIKAECPFLLHYERRSFLSKELRRQKMKGVPGDFPGIKEEAQDDDIITSETGDGAVFDSKKFKKSLERRGRPIKTKTENGYAGDETDIPNDPYFLVKYRSFHNHDLDTNYTEHAHLIMDEELHKKGSINFLPQSPCAIQWLCGQQRKEIPEEGKLTQMPIQFDQITTVQTVYMLDAFGVDPKHIQMRVIEPAGMPPAIFVLDQTEPPDDPHAPLMNIDANQQIFWPPLDNMVQEARSLIVQTMRIVLGEVSSRLSDGRYNLDRWRRILTYIKPKAFARAITADTYFKKHPSTGRLLGLTQAAINELSGGSTRSKLAQREQQGITSLVNQIQIKTNGERRGRPRGSTKANSTATTTASNPAPTTIPDDDEPLIDIMPPDDEDTYNIYN